MARNSKASIYAVYIHDPAETNNGWSLGIDEYRFYRNLKDAREAILKSLLAMCPLDFNPKEEDEALDVVREGKIWLASKELWPINEAGEPHDEWPVDESVYSNHRERGWDGAGAALYERVFN